MKKATTIFTIVAVLAMLLAACSSNSAKPGENKPGDEGNYPSASEPAASGAQQGSSYPAPAETAVGEAPTTMETPVGEAAPASGAANTNEAAPASGSTSAGTPEATVEATVPVTGTEVIPPTGSMDPGRLSNLMGATVTTQDGTQIGQVDDFIFDLSTGKVTYVVVSVSAEGNSKQTLVPIPFALFSWDASSGAFKLSADQKTVTGAPSFQGSEYPDTQTAGWDAKFQDYWKNASPGG